MAKRKIMLTYGEQTETLSIRVPISKKSEIQVEFEGILKKYENPQRIEIDVRESEQRVSKDIAYQKPVTIHEAFENIEKKSNPADNTTKGLVSKVSEVNTFEYVKPILESDVLKVEQEVVDDKIEYEILESFPFGIEKFEDFGKNKAIYFYDPNYYTRVVNEKAKHISYGSAVNYLKSK